MTPRRRRRRNGLEGGGGDPFLVSQYFNNIYLIYLSNIIISLKKFILSSLQ
jgi:hypothetical protein